MVLRDELNRFYIPIFRSFRMKIAKMSIFSQVQGPVKGFFKIEITGNTSIYVEHIGNGH